MTLIVRSSFSGKAVLMCGSPVPVVTDILVGRYATDSALVFVLDYHFTIDDCRPPTPVLFNSFDFPAKNLRPFVVYGL